jgi:TRAP transporter 4TM/12TM fusion protein
MGNRSAGFTKAIEIVAAIVATAMVIYHTITVFFYLQIPSGNLNTHLLFAFLIVFLIGAQRGKYRVLKILMALIGLLATLYIQLNVWDLEERAGGLHSTLELVIGLTIMLLSVLATYQEFGAPLPIVGTLFILYGYFGHLLPGALHTAPISFERFIASLCLNMEGVYGIILSVSANYIFFFMVFAGLMEGTGAVNFFHEIGKFIGRKFRGGPAITAVITSGLVGMVSGQAGANVAITGSFTIPAMKKAGYKPEQAGAIEAAASSGGPIIPPVMGIAAFIMAGIIGISYTEVIFAAAIPALIYVCCCLFYVILQARKLQIPHLSEKVDTKEIFYKLPLFLVPLLVITTLFIKGFSPLYVGFWASAIMVALSLIRKSTRPSANQLCRSIVNGAKLGSQIAVSCAFLGMMVKVITMTGLGVVLPRILTDLCGGNLFLLLIFMGVVSIILGTGLPAATSYIMVAVVMAPALLKMGLPVLTSHFFAFYFCNFSYITPPVALACVFASKLAEARYMRTGIEAVKVGMAGFVIPFMIIWCPALLLNFSEPMGLMAAKIISCFIALFCLQISNVNYYVIHLNTFERVMFILCSFLFFVNIYSGSILSFVTGGIIFIGLTSWQKMKYSKLKDKGQLVIEQA